MVALSGLLESEAGTKIKISDCSKTTFEKMLEYIYTDSVASTGLFGQKSIFWNNWIVYSPPELITTDINEIIELLGMADEYFLTGMKTKCEDILASPKCLDKDTAISLLKVADRYRAMRLKVTKIGTIKNNLFLAAHHQLKLCQQQLFYFIIRNVDQLVLSEIESHTLAELVYYASTQTKQPLRLQRNPGHLFSTTSTLHFPPSAMLNTLTFCWILSHTCNTGFV